MTDFYGKTESAKYAHVSKWDLFIKELSRLYLFWLIGVIYFSLFRITFILIFREQISSNISFITDLFNTLLMGFRFDITVIAYFILIPLVILLSFSYSANFRLIKTVRIIFQYLFIISSALISIVTINYFLEYNSQFNHFLFMALYDDRKAVAKTILDDFNPLLNLTVLLFIIGALILAFRYFNKKPFLYNLFARINFKGSHIFVIALTLVLFVISIRGSIGDVPAIRKWSGVASCPFLNKTVINPFRSFKYALNDFHELNSVNNNNPYIDEKLLQKSCNEPIITDYLRKYVQEDKPTTEKPKQIFIVVMESYDSWPLIDKYLPFNFSSSLHLIAEKGIHFNNFLPASTSTFNSLGAIITNVPYCGVNISRLSVKNEPFETSIFNQLKKLGYQANFYYGGFLSWQNIGEFVFHQGADRVFSGANAGGKSDSGNWGVEDHKLFDLVLKHTDPDTYSLNIILTSTYHAPYSIDIYKEGFPYKNPEDFPDIVKPYYDGAMSMIELGHLWYGDKAIGDFMAAAELKYPDGLFCFTGDHFGRKFINHKPNLYERSSVPFIIYGRQVTPEKNPTPGSHIDIMPTLIEMIAPKDFEYYSFGNSLYDSLKNRSTGFETMIVGQTLYSLSEDNKIDVLNLETLEADRIDSLPGRHYYNQFMGLAWQYTVKGKELK